jgi:Sulfotransferase domain
MIRVANHLERDGARPAMNIRLHKLRYVLAAAQSKAALFVRQPAAFLFYVRHYSAEKRASSHIAVTVVSYPKSGRTWLELLLLAALGHHCGQRFGNDATYSNVAAKFDDVPLVAFTHAGGSWETATFTAAEIATYTPHKIVDGRFIYLYRAPRDVLVSAYHHARNRSGISWLRPQDMLDDPIVGLPKLVAFMNNWTRHVAGASERAMSLSYERLKAAPQQTFAELSRFIGLPLSQDEIRKAIEDCTFDRLKKREMEATGANPWLAPVDPSNPDSFKFREGRSGSYKTFFEPEQIKWIENYMAQNLLNADQFLNADLTTASARV